MDINVTNIMIMILLISITLRMSMKIKKAHSPRYLFYNKDL